MSKIKRASIQGTVGRAVYGQRMTRGGRVVWYAALPGGEPLLARDEEHAREIAAVLDRQDRQARQAVDWDRVGRSALGGLWDRLPDSLRSMWVWAKMVFCVPSPHETIGYSAHALDAILNGRFPEPALVSAGVDVSGIPVLERHHIGGSLVPFYRADDLV